MGKWAVAGCYPADCTVVFATELEDLAVNYDEFKNLGVEIYPVSTDTHFSHKAWHDTSDAIGKIKYPLIGDPTHEISSNFETLRPTGLADPGTFIVDQQRVITTNAITTAGPHCNSPALMR